MLIRRSNSTEHLFFPRKGKQTGWKINEFLVQGMIRTFEWLFRRPGEPRGCSFHFDDYKYLWYCERVTPSVTVLCLVLSGEWTLLSPLSHQSTESQLQISFIVAVKLLLLSLLQRVSFSAMMEDLGISLRCYQGIRKRSRMYCRAKSACVLCQPRCVPKRVEGRRDSSMWAWEKSADLWSDWTNLPPQWTILHHQSPFSLYLRINVIL